MDIEEETPTIPLDFYMESNSGPWIQERKLNTAQKISQGNVLSNDSTSKQGYWNNYYTM